MKHWQPFLQAHRLAPLPEAGPKVSAYQAYDESYRTTLRFEQRRVSLRVRRRTSPYLNWLTSTTISLQITQRSQLLTHHGCLHTGVQDFDQQVALIPAPEASADALLLPFLDPMLRGWLQAHVEAGGWAFLLEDDAVELGGYVLDASHAEAACASFKHIGERFARWQNAQLHHVLQVFHSQPNEAQRQLALRCVGHHFDQALDEGGAVLVDALDALRAAHLNESLHFLLEIEPRRIEEPDVFSAFVTALLECSRLDGEEARASISKTLSHPDEAFRSHTAELCLVYLSQAMNGERLGWLFAQINRRNHKQLFPLLMGWLQSESLPQEVCHLWAEVPYFTEQSYRLWFGMAHFLALRYPQVGGPMEDTILHLLGRDQSAEATCICADILGAIGTGAALLALREAKRGWLTSGQVKKAVSQAIEAIERRYAHGALSLATEGGELSHPPEPGGLSTPEDA